MIKVRDAGESEKYRYTVIMSTPLGTYFYSFPQDANANYRFLGEMEEDCIPDSDRFGEVVDPEKLPAHWGEVVHDLHKEALDNAREAEKTK